MAIDNSVLVGICTVAVAGFACAASTVTAILSYLTSRKVDTVGAKIEHIDSKVAKVDTQVVENGHRMDGRLDELVRTTKDLAYAVGVKDEQERSRSQT